jgi:hypothetical protein
MTCDQEIQEEVADWRPFEVQATCDITFQILAPSIKVLDKALAEFGPDDWAEMDGGELTFSWNLSDQLKRAVEKATQTSNPSVIRAGLADELQGAINPDEPTSIWAVEDLGISLKDHLDQLAEKAAKKLAMQLKQLNLPGIDV